MNCEFLSIKLLTSGSQRNWVWSKDLIINNIAVQLKSFLFKELRAREIPVGT